jgi:hypothetical protein
MPYILLDPCSPFVGALAEPTPPAEYTVNADGGRKSPGNDIDVVPITDPPFNPFEAAAPIPAPPQPPVAKVQAVAKLRFVPATVVPPIMPATPA